MLTGFNCCDDLAHFNDRDRREAYAPCFVRKGTRILVVGEGNCHTLLVYCPFCGKLLADNLEDNDA